MDNGQPENFPKSPVFFVNRVACARIFVHKENEISVACRLHVVYEHASKFYFKKSKESTWKT
jgi:hypothetical protein